MKLTRKSIGRIAASFVATAMLATMAIVPASAAGVTSNGTGVTSIPFNKTVTTDGNSYAPATTFEFNVTNGMAGNYSYVDDEGETVTVDNVLAGIGGVTIADIQSDPNDFEDSPASAYVLNGAVSINAETFKSVAPGVYHYVISEQAGNYEGMSYDDAVYDLYLYVVNGSTGVNDHYVAHAVAVARVPAVDPEEGLVPGTAKTDIAFTNDYDKDNAQLHDITVVKRVEGTMGDKVNDTFDFSVSVTGEQGEIFYITYKTNATASEQTASVVSGNSVTIPGIKHDGTITIYGLDTTDTYIVTETETGTGYTTYVDSNYQSNDTHETEGSVAGTSLTGNGTADQTVAFYNVKNAISPTGIMMDIAPYAVLVVIAAAGCFIFLRKRHAKED